MARSRKNRYVQLARGIAAQHQVPVRLFLSMIEHESGWNPAAVSSAGALGLGQLMPGTARGLDVDPLDPRQNLTGAARYLRSQYERFGNWRDALRAYNQGPNAIGEPGAGLEYATSVLKGRNAYARGTNAVSVSTSSSGLRQGPSPRARNTESLARALFADDPEFLPFALDVAWGPTNGLEPDQVITKRGRKASFDGATLTLPTSWGGSHTTSGDLRYGDWPSMSAVDIMSKPGTSVGAPESGVILDWGSAQGGQALYFLADSGWLYWIGHIDSRLPVGRRVKRGQQLAVVSADHPAPHVHVDKKRYRR